MSRKWHYHIGVDEAGRGPLAGPVAVAAIMMRPGILRKFRGVKDSKKLSSLQRERWFAMILQEKNKGNLDFKVSLVGNGIIDKRGISKAIEIGIMRIFHRIDANPQKSTVLLDGLLRAPKKFMYQKTHIKGDENFRIISLASIIAKVTRDKKMKKLSIIYPQYRFYLHKGYGTSLHIKIIKKYRPSAIHRISFLNKILTI